MNPTCEPISTAQLPVEPAPPRRSGSGRHPVAWTLFAAFVGALALQLWRPLFFLTDDTVSGWLPVATEAYRRLYEGGNPLVNDYLFGGGFRLAEDPAIFDFLGPWMLLFSFLAKTPFYYLLPEVVGTLSLVTIAGAFCASALHLRKILGLPVSDRLIVALSISYAFTPYNFLVGTSWIGFLSAPAAYPVVVAAAFEPRARRAVAWQVGALLYAILGGHSHPFLTLVLFCTLLTALLAWFRRQPAVFGRWLVAVTVTLLLLLPLLLPALHGFGHTTRGQGMTVDQARYANVEAFPLLSSFVFGPVSHLFLPGIVVNSSDVLYNLGIAFSLVNVPLLGVLLTKRRYNGFELGLLVCAACAVLAIIRPAWVQETLRHLPLLRSLGWPFREITGLTACSHLLFLAAYRGFRWKPAPVLLTGLAACSYALLFLCSAPTFWPFELDRRLIVSGQAERYWTAFKAEFGEKTPRIAVAMSPAFMRLARPEIPYSLLGGYNFGSLFRVVNLSGYSPTPPVQAVELARRTGVTAPLWGGAYLPPALDALGVSDPTLYRVLLTGVFPARWRITGPRQTQELDYRGNPPRVLRVDPQSPTPRLFYAP